MLYCVKLMIISILDVKMSLCILNMIFDFIVKLLMLYGNFHIHKCRTKVSPKCIETVTLVYTQKSDKTINSSSLFFIFILCLSNNFISLNMITIESDIAYGGGGSGL